MSDSPLLPTDHYSRELERLHNNPAVIVGRGSTIRTRDFYGNTATWVLQVLRVNGDDTGFIQRITFHEGMCLVIPPEVMAALFRQREATVSKARRRGAQIAKATREARGIKPNTAGLQRHLAAKKRKGKK